MSEVIGSLVAVSTNRWTRYLCRHISDFGDHREVVIPSLIVIIVGVDIAPFIHHMVFRDNVHLVGGLKVVERRAWVPSLMDI